MTRLLHYISSHSWNIREMHSKRISQVYFQKRVCTTLVFYAIIITSVYVLLIFKLKVKCARGKGGIELYHLFGVHVK